MDVLSVDEESRVSAWFALGRTSIVRWDAGGVCLNRMCDFPLLSLHSTTCSNPLCCLVGISGGRSLPVFPVDFVVPFVSCFPCLVCKLDWLLPNLLVYGAEGACLPPTFVDWDLNLNTTIRRVDWHHASLKRFLLMLQVF